MIRILAFIAVSLSQFALAGQGFLMAFEGDSHRVVSVLGVDAVAGQAEQGLPSVIVHLSAELPEGVMEVRAVRPQGVDSQALSLADPRIVRAPMVPGVGHERAVKDSGSYLIPIDGAREIVELELTLPDL